MGAEVLSRGSSISLPGSLRHGPKAPPRVGRRLRCRQRTPTARTTLLPKTRRSPSPGRCRGGARDAAGPGRTPRGHGGSTVISANLFTRPKLNATESPMPLARRPDEREEIVRIAGQTGSSALVSPIGAHRNMPQANKLALMGSTVAYNQVAARLTPVGTYAHIVTFGAVRWCVRGEGRSWARGERRGRGGFRSGGSWGWHRRWRRGPAAASVGRKRVMREAMGTAVVVDRGPSGYGGRPMAGA